MLLHREIVRLKSATMQVTQRCPLPEAFVSSTNLSVQVDFTVFQYRKTGRLWGSCYDRFCASRPAVEANCRLREEHAVRRFRLHKLCHSVISLSEEEKQSNITFTDVYAAQNGSLAFVAAVKIEHFASADSEMYSPVIFLADMSTEMLGFFLETTFSEN